MKAKGRIIRGGGKDPHPLLLALDHQRNAASSLSNSSLERARLLLNLQMVGSTLKLAGLALHFVNVAAICLPWSDVAGAHVTIRGLR